MATTKQTATRAADAPVIIDAQLVAVSETDETARPPIYVATRRLVLELAPATDEAPARTLVVDPGEPFSATKAMLKGLAADAYRASK